MSLYKNKSALVTGGTGYFGGAFVRHLLDSGVDRVVVYSRDEFKQYQMAGSLSDSRVEYVIGDVRDYDSLKAAVGGCDLLIHAAALKHVPACERSPSEAVKTNIVGAMNVVKACGEARVKKVIALSTDKAVYPINAMGCSKMMAEKVFLSSGLDVSVVRYGNVVNSRGSFVEALLDGRFGDVVPITSASMTRFIMSVQDAMWLVDKSFQGGSGLYVRKCVSANIMDIVWAILGEGFKFKIVGERGGEKLNECLMTFEESKEAIDLGGAYYIGKGGGVGSCGGEGFEFSSDKCLIEREAVRSLFEAKGIISGK